MKMIKIILFDVGGVLLKDIFVLFREYLEKKYNITEEQWNVFVTTRKKFWPRYLLGGCDITDFFNNLAEGTGWPKEDLPDMIEETYSLLQWIPESEELVKELKEKETRMGILSNNSKEWSQYVVNNLGFKEYFTEFFFSCDLNMGKPFPNMYEHVIKTLNLKPEEILFIDNIPANIKGAEKAGMQGIVFTSTDQLRKELENLNLL